MRRCDYLVAFLLFFQAAASAEEDRPTPLKVLFIGNSYTAVNDLPGMVEALANAAGGQRIQTERRLVGGSTLERHAQDKMVIDKIREEKWDVVVLQEQSLRPVLDREAMHKHARILGAAIRQTGARTVFYLTWARQHIPEMQQGADPGTSPDYARAMYNIGEAEKPADFDAWCQQQEAGLQGGLNGAYFDIASDLGAKVAPVGMAWQNALATDPSFVLHKPDNSHPNPKGTYLAACVFYATLLESNPVGLPGDLKRGDQTLVSVPGDEAKRLQEIAWESVVEMNGSERLDGAKSVGVTAVRVDASPEPALQQVAETKGLVAFWDFTWMQDGEWTSRHDDHVVNGGYPVVLRRIGDHTSYTPGDWPYKDEQSKLVFDSSGPFGHAIRFNQGYIFAEVPRQAFDQSPLDIHGRQPFTLIAWIKFIGKRHLVAGIWDEGGWDKYGGRRQIALFGGLFGSKGVIGHISATGASSYPQSTISGSQYARCRAIDGRGFENDRWVAMAMTFDPGAEQVTVYCDGVATPTQITDPVAKDVFRYKEPVASNPYQFPWPVYSPRSFVLKFNGYNLPSNNISEHWLHVDAENGTVAYDRSHPDREEAAKQYRVVFDAGKAGAKRDTEPIIFEAVRKKVVKLPKHIELTTDREIVTSLEFHEDGEWKRVGKQVRYRIREGAPFTFGRALGLGTEPIDHGTQIFIDGVAVFNRVLSNEELMELSFTAR